MILHWKTYLVIAFRYWVKVVVWMLFTTVKKIDVSSAKNLQFEERSLDKSLT